MFMSSFIYRFLNKDNKIIYVGKTSDISRRIELQHFTKSGHLPLACYLNTNKVEYATLNNDIETSIYEMYYINLYKPKYNSTYNSRKEKDEETQITLEELEWVEYKNFNSDLKKEQKKKVVIARLREGRDDDIQEELLNIPAYIDQSDIVREALRQFFKNNPGIYR